MNQKINDSTDPIILGRVLPKTTDTIHQNQELLGTGGVSMTIKRTHYKDPPKILVLCDMEVGGSVEECLVIKE